MIHTDIARRCGLIVFEATARGWDVVKAVRSQQSEARYLTLRNGKGTFTVRVADHPKRNGRWDVSVESDDDLDDLFMMFKKRPVSSNG